MQYSHFAMDYNDRPKSSWIGRKSTFILSYSYVKRHDNDEVKWTTDKERMKGRCGKGMEA